MAEFHIQKAYGNGVGRVGTMPPLPKEALADMKIIASFRNVELDDNPPYSETAFSSISSGEIRSGTDYIAKHVKMVLEDAGHEVHLDEDLHSMPGTDPMFLPDTSSH